MAPVVPEAQAFGSDWLAGYTRIASALKRGTRAVAAQSAVWLVAVSGVLAGVALAACALPAARAVRIEAASVLRDE